MPDNGKNIYVLNYIFLKKWHPYFWIALGCFVLYFKTLAFRFSFFDDNTLIIENLWYLKDLRHIFDAFKQTVFLDSDDFFYRPILTISFIFNAHFCGSAPFIYHLTNVIFHAVASCLALTFFQSFGYGRRFAFILSGIFLAHPALVQAVAWIPGRNDSLLAIFVLASLASFISYSKNYKPQYFFVHLICFNLALYTKETALVICPLCVLCYFLCFETHPFSSKQWINFASGWILSAFVWFAMRHSTEASAAATTLHGRAFFISLKDMPLSLLQYVGKVIFPFNLSGYPITQDTGSIYGILALLIIVAAYIFTNPLRRKKSLFGFFWFAIFILPTFMLPDMVRLEHRLYLPIIGIFILLSEFVLSHKSLFRRKIFIGAASLIVILFAVISFNHSDIFISRLPFWKSAVADSPHSSSAHNTLGVRYLEYDLSHLAEDEFSKSIKLSPGNINALINLSIISQYKNDYEKADRLLAMAMRLKPSEYLTWFNLGLLRYSQGNDKEAVDCWNKTLDINPNYYYGYRTLAGYYFLHGDAQAQKYLKICQYQFNRPVNIPATAALQGRNWLIKFILYKLGNSEKTYND